MNVPTSSLLETIETLPASSTLLLHEVLAGFVQQGRAYGIIPMIRAFRDWMRAHRQP